MAAMVKKSVKFVQASAYKVDKDSYEVVQVGVIEYIGSSSERAARKACTAAGYAYDFVKIDGESVKTYAMPIDVFVANATELDGDAPDAPTIC